MSSKEGPMDWSWGWLFVAVAVAWVGAAGVAIVLGQVLGLAGRRVDDDEAAAKGPRAPFRVVKGGKP